MPSTSYYIGNYRVITQLSSDRLSHVYLAEHTFSAGLPVAIRLWHSIHFTSAQEYEAFVQEAQRMVMLRHPHILPVIDFGMEGASPYVVTEYDGMTNGTLRNRLASQSPFPLQEALTLLSQIGQALHYAHQHNIIHRQLSPEHLHFNAQGQVLLADFGLATILGASTNQHLDAVGTDSYMAPLPSQGTTSKLSDQYALGCIAYELLTGHQPSQIPLPPTQLNPSLPLSIEQVILKAMAKEPIHRYPDVGTFIAALCASAISATPTIPGASIQNTSFKPFSDAKRPGIAKGAETVTLASLGTASTPDIKSGRSIPLTGSSPTRGSRGIRPRRLRDFALIALIILLVVGALASLASYLFTILPASAATVTITPTSRHLANTYTIMAVTGSSDPSQHQGQARLISYTTPMKSKTVNATGQQSATAATGTLTFSNPDNTVTIHAGTEISDANGITFSLDNDVTVQVNSSATGTVHAVKSGSSGNIPAYDFSASYVISQSITNKYLATLYVQNTSAFTGGQDAYTFVQQSDIDGATNDLETQLTSDAQDAVHKQIQANEQTINDIACNPKTTSNHRANDHSTNVTVTTAVTCQVEVYAPHLIQSIAADWLKSDATAQLGASYALVGAVLTGSPTLLTTGDKGTASFSVKAEGVWRFQFSDALKQQLAQAIAGKNQADTTALLLKQPGIRKVSLATAGGWGSALPTSPTAIKFVVVDVPGL